jgi:GDPmannose 4,6-dehydratase
MKQFNGDNMKKAIITGITGQDGYYLTKFLLKKGYNVFGIQKNINSNKSINFQKEFKKVKVYECDIVNYNCVNKIINLIKPDEIYNFAAQSISLDSERITKKTFDINLYGVLNILDSIKNSDKSIKFLQASSSEIFGSENLESPQNENTPYNPENPYALSKIYADYLVKMYRNQFKIFACSAILYNHESKMRGDDYVTKKIANSVANIKKSEQEKLYLGNLNAKRDWGHAKDYVEGMWLMLQEKIPENYILATGKLHTVREFVKLSFEEIGINIKWEGENINEKGIDSKNGNILVEIDSKYFRNKDSSKIYGDSSKAQKKLNWIPDKTSFENIVKEMVFDNLKK